MASIPLQPSASLDALSQSIHDHVMAFYDRRLALKTPLDSPNVEDVLACAIALEKIVRSGKRYVKKTRAALAPWIQTIPLDSSDNDPLTIEKAETLLQRLVLIQAHSALDQLSSVLNEWQGIAANYREWADPVSRQYRAALKQSGSPPQSKESLNELPKDPPKSKELPHDDHPTTTPNETHDAPLPDRLENALDRHADTLVYEINSLRYRINSYHAKYRHGHVLDFKMAQACLGVIHPLRHIMAMKNDSLREAQRDRLMRKSKEAQQKPAPRTAKPIKKSPVVPPEWSIVKP